MNIDDARWLKEQGLKQEGWGFVYVKNTNGSIRLLPSIMAGATPEGLPLPDQDLYSPTVEELMAFAVKKIKSKYSDRIIGIGLLYNIEDDEICCFFNRKDSGAPFLDDGTVDGIDSDPRVAIVSALRRAVGE